MFNITTRLIFLNLVRISPSCSGVQKGIPPPSEVSPKSSLQGIHRSLLYLLLTPPPWSGCSSCCSLNKPDTYHSLWLLHQLVPFLGALFTPDACMLHFLVSFSYNVIILFTIAHPHPLLAMPLTCFFCFLALNRSNILNIYLSSPFPLFIVSSIITEIFVFFFSHWDLPSSWDSAWYRVVNGYLLN